MLGKHGKYVLLAYLSAFLTRTGLHSFTCAVLGRISVNAPLLRNDVSERVFFISLFFEITFIGITAPKLVSAFLTRRLYGLVKNHIMLVIGNKDDKTNIMRGHYRSSGLSVKGPFVIICLKCGKLVDHRKLRTGGQIGNVYYVVV